MKKYLILFFFISTASFSSQVFFSTKDSSYYDSVTKIKYTGLVELKYFPSGKVKEEMYLSNGRILSLTIYYTNGKVKEEYSRRKGIHEENYDKKYYMTGEIKEELIYDEWSLEPYSYTSYFKNNQKESKVHFGGNGDKLVKWKYNESGQLVELTRYYEQDHSIKKVSVDNTIISPSFLKKQIKLYDENNQQQLKSEAFYKNGNADGTHKVYYDDGSLSEVNYYDNGKKVGIWKSFYKNGKVWVIESYENGLKTGVTKAYDEFGGLASESFYKGDKPIGVWKRYYSNGKKRQETHYKDGKIQKTYYFKPNGKKTTEKKMWKLNYEIENDKTTKSW